jgi:hypothetical protein
MKDQPANLAMRVGNIAAQSLLAAANVIAQKAWTMVTMSEKWLGIF